ncbi:ricin-type beta-trefoil lectin domain protein [Streptomyces sp. AC627_RSS907]|uniref:ricin-type beta-trefoil lectin domain protein n=1 Tax=Streptomyces sp. AC627_RSS907 TaxID=2823684 RepID=UPI001C214C7B|nr:ricin-type beta-trefoil lectin domain protein [Streptomyces sp. AC627_RSS907]
MRKTTVSLAAAGLILAGAAPATAGTEQGTQVVSRMLLANGYTSLCLGVQSAGPRVLQKVCSLASEGIHWTVDQPFGDAVAVYRIRNDEHGMCLDNDNTSVFLAPCNAAQDAGQLWRFPDGSYGRVEAYVNGKVLTGWSDGAASLRSWSPSDADLSQKQRWRQVPRP